MGSVDRLDGAITKAAFIIRKLVALRQKLAGEMAETPGNLITIHLVDRDHRNCLILEGGQGFLPTHSLDEVCRRMREAVSVGIQAYAKLVGFQPEAIVHQTTFDKLHNDAFARPATGRAMTALLNAARSTGIYHGEPVRGWDASCDARIFARQFPDAQIITFGPGALAQAHADTEHILVADLISAAETMTRMALAYSCS